MRNYDYGVPSCTSPRMRTSLMLRPKSQHVRSFQAQLHQSPKPLTPRSPQPTLPSSFIRIPNNSASNQCYHQSRFSGKKDGREVVGSQRKNSLNVSCDAQKIDKIRKIVMEKMERWVGELRGEIYRQSALIMQLQKRIQMQERDIDSKNELLQKLVKSMQQHKCQNANATEAITNEHVVFKKVRDLEEKIRLVVQQLQDETVEVNGKIDKLLTGFLSCYGSRLTNLKQNFASFVELKQKQIDDLTNKLKAAQTGSQLLHPDNFYRTNPSTLSMKNSGGSVRDTCSSANNSKQSLISEDRAQVRMKKDQSIFSDYFFHPSEHSQIESSNMRAVEELVREREKLPMKVYLDSAGRMKYTETRTFIFDRKGNFTTPTRKEIEAMEHRGWIKMNE